MEDKILRSIKEDIEDVKNLLETDFSELKELEQDDLVKRYMRISRLKYELKHGLRLDNDKDIARHEYMKYASGEIKNSNKFLYFIGVFTPEEYLEIYGTESGLEGNVKVFVDLENENWHYRFKENHEYHIDKYYNFIITENPSWNDYYRLREKFFLDCIEYGQEDAVNNMMVYKRSINSK